MSNSKKSQNSTVSRLLQILKQFKALGFNGQLYIEAEFGVWGSHKNGQLVFARFPDIGVSCRIVSFSQFENTVSAVSKCPEVKFVLDSGTLRIEAPGMVTKIAAHPHVPGDTAFQFLTGLPDATLSNIVQLAKFGLKSKISKLYASSGTAFVVDDDGGMFVQSPFVGTPTVVMDTNTVSKLSKVSSPPVGIALNSRSPFAFILFSGEFDIAVGCIALDQSNVSLPVYHPVTTSALSQRTVEAILTLSKYCDNWMHVTSPVTIEGIKDGGNVTLNVDEGLPCGSYWNLKLMSAILELNAKVAFKTEGDISMRFDTDTVMGEIASMVVTDAG
jgi:hypothetical protein